MDYNSEKMYSVSLAEREWVLITNTLWLDHNFELSEKIEDIIEKEKNKMTGIVKWFNNKHGYGFITKDNGEDVFVHWTSIISEKKFKYLDDGDNVSFDVEVRDNRVMAVNVQKVEV